MASLFVSSLCTLDSKNVPSLVAWSTMDPIIAVASYSSDSSHSIQFFTNEGVAYPNANVQGNSGARPTAISWQPGGRILAIGWSDGMLSCWFFDGRSRPTSSFSSNSTHNSTVTVLKWNPAGKRLVSGDKVGR